MSLEIYIDPKDPLAYLALPGTANLMAQVLDPLPPQANIEIHWLPMQVEAWSNPGPEPATDAGRGVRHRWFRANYRERELEYYAGVHQLPLTNLYRQTDSGYAALALLWLSKQPEAATLTLNFLQQLTRSYWAEPNATMDSAACILALLSTAATAATATTTTTTTTEGLAKRFEDYCAGQGPNELAHQLEINANLGVIRGPAFRFEDQLYIGREHLRLLATLISE